MPAGLRGIALFHFVMAVLCLPGASLFWKNYSVFNETLTVLASTPAIDVPYYFFAFKWFNLASAVACVILLFLNPVSGCFILRSRFRLFSLIVAAMNILLVPIGTVLGILTFGLLSRGVVRRLYDGSDAG
jgi:hypothetical protein